MSRFTMCALIAIAGPPCPGEPHGPNGEPPQFGKPFLPRVRTENGRAVVPVTFPDGTSADVVFPTGVDASGWAVQPALGMRIDDKELVRFSRDELYPSVVQQPDLPPTLSKYRGRGSTHVNVDYLGLMNIHAGKWVVSVDASFMSERQRRALARAVRLSEHDGFPVIEAKAPVELYGREGRPTAAGFAAAPSKGGGGGIGPGASDHAQLQFVPKDEPAPSPDATAAPTDSSGPPQPFPPTVSLASGACKRSDPGELHVDTSGAEPSAPMGGGFEQADQYPVTVRRCIPGTGIQVEATAFPQLVAAQLAGQTEIRNVRRR